VTERVLTRRELNRALLARQLLLERVRLPVGPALERVAGIQAQDVVPPFIGLWTRLAGFERSDLTRALHRRSAVRATLMRGTIHIVSARDYASFAPATLPMVRRLYRGSLRGRQPVADVERLTARALVYAAEPRTGAEMRDFLGGEDAWWRIRREALFVNAPGDEPWSFSRRRRFVAASAWFDRPLADVETGRDHLVRRYLAAFGPATTADVSAWSGLTAAELRPSLERLRLRRFRDERGRLLVDVPGAPLPDPRTPAPPRLLPLFDNTLLSHADRTRVISDEHRRVVIRGGMVDAAFLVDGFVAGVWRLRKDSFELEPFERLSRRVDRELRREGAAVEAFVG
jgi:Winged helix DNA-binding domain